LSACVWGLDYCTIGCGETGWGYAVG
jgi:hypothetical protein